MAVDVTITVSQFVGNGSAVTPYPTGFAFQDATWLKVYVTDAAGISTLLTSGVHYSVTGAGDEDGGDVTTVLAYAATHKITIARVTPLTQLLDLEYNDRLPAQLVEDSLDKLTFALQEVRNTKALSFPPTDPPAFETEVPDPAVRKGCVVGFDSVTGEAVIFEMPIPVVPIAPPTEGTYILGAVDGVLQWVETVNCA